MSKIVTRFFFSSKGIFSHSSFIKRIMEDEGIPGKYCWQQIEKKVLHRRWKTVKRDVLDLLILCADTMTTNPVRAAMQLKHSTIQGEVQRTISHKNIVGIFKIQIQLAWKILLVW